MTSSAGPHQQRKILVLVGTDIHPFSRIVDWADCWASSHREDEVVVQHGYTAPPKVARGVDILPPDELSAIIAESQVIVTHAGPGTIAAVRAAHIVPVIVPRDPQLGEHVDSHQLRFAAWAAEHKLGTVVINIQNLDNEINIAFEHRYGSDSATLSDQIDETAANIAALARNLVNGQKKRWALPFVRRPRRLWDRRS